MDLNFLSFIAKLIKKGAAVAKIITILYQNSICHVKAVEVGLFGSAVPNLGKFFYID